MARTVPVGPAGGTVGYIAITCPEGGGAVAVDSVKISQNTGIHQGQLVGWKAKAMPCTNAVNFTVSLKDRDGDVIYGPSAAQTSHAVNALIHILMGLNIPLIEQEKIVITPDAEPGVTGLIVRMTLYYNPDADIIAWGYR